MIRESRKSGQIQRMPTFRLQSWQARAARSSLGWSVRQLAQQSGISESSIRRIESEFGVPENVTLDMLTRLREFYEGKGFTFTFEPDPGVTWRRKERRKGDRRGSDGGPIEASRIGPDGLPDVTWLG
jgi:transcriptional regulator with XRE-family HTH domain